MIDIRDEQGKLLMRYNPSADTIEIQRRGIKTNIDLGQYRSAMSDINNDERFAQLRSILYQCYQQATMPIDMQGLPRRIQEAIALVNDLESEFKSATSAANQGGADGRQPNE